MGLRERIDEAVKAVGSPLKPDFAIILGTGLGAVASAIDKKLVVPYEKIPHFAKSTVASHKGDLIIGTLEGRNVVAMEGRFHSYEGYSMEQITFPVRVMKAMGAKALVVSNACGGLNLDYAKADLMLIEDHINLLSGNPLTGPNDDSLGPRFPDLYQPYDPEFRKLAKRIAAEEKIPVREGVYVAVSGPNLETRAEYRFLRKIGADVVGMSTVPEVLVGVHSAMRILGISIVTDLCDPDHLHPVKLEDILEVARVAEPRMGTLLRRFVREAAL